MSSVNSINSVNSVNFAKGVNNMDCEKIICDRLKEAQAALKNGYNEQAEFDAALISVVLGLCDKNKHPSAATGKEYLQVQPMDAIIGIPYADMCHDELHEATKYHALYVKTKSKMWEHIAKQELSHCAATLEMWVKAGGDKNEIAAVRSKLIQMEKEIK